MTNRILQFHNLKIDNVIVECICSQFLFSVRRIKEDSVINFYMFNY